jgi:O-acetyl-ADP-ribose deacetylase (regulator of RNase III)
MSIKLRSGNLLEMNDIDVIIHTCNLYHTMGAGLAKQIAELYPEVLEADKQTPHGDSSKLGTFSYAKIDGGAYGKKTVINLYSMQGLGTNKRQTHYEAFYLGMEAIHNQIVDSKKDLTVGIPKYIGCGLAGGSWRVIQAMIEDIFEESSVKLVIVEWKKD